MTLAMPEKSARSTQLRPHHLQETMANIETPTRAFLFLDLSPELRIMVYRELLVGTDYRLYHGLKCPFRKPVFDTALLQVNRQLQKEASAILYTQNKIILHIDYCCYDCWRRRSTKKALLRTDNSPGGLRKLRSGRTVDTMTAFGQVYPHVLARFTQLEIMLSWPTGSSPAYPRAEDGCSIVLWILKDLLEAICAHEATMSEKQGSLTIYFRPMFDTEYVVLYYVMMALWLI